MIGLLSDCMSHDVALPVHQLGEYLERADMTTRISRHPRGGPGAAQQVPEDPAIALLWMGVLKSLAGIRCIGGTLRSRSRSGGRGVSAQDAHFPRTRALLPGGNRSVPVELPDNVDGDELLRIAQRRLSGMHVTARRPPCGTNISMPCRPISRRSMTRSPRPTSICTATQTQSQGVVAG